MLTGNVDVSFFFFFRTMFHMEEEVLEIPISLCSFWQQPSSVDDELERSIRELGVITPVIVRRREEEYQVCLGQRRLLAAIRLGLDEIPGCWGR